MTITSSLRFLYIFWGSGLLCATELLSCATVQWFQLMFGTITKTSARVTFTSSFLHFFFSFFRVRVMFGMMNPSYNWLGSQLTRSRALVALGSARGISKKLARVMLTSSFNSFCIFLGSINIIRKGVMGIFRTTYLLV